MQSNLHYYSTFIPIRNVIIYVIIIKLGGFSMSHLGVNSLRTLSIDMIDKANSGHPGICMGSAPIVELLYSKYINVYAKESNWINRDRFVMSAGHGSALLYAALHISGYDLSIYDLQEFRQINSKTPGHPEFGYTDGVDVTTGPLGQGIAQGVGMALAEKHLGAKYNKKDLKIFDHYTYILCGDGDLQEGVSSEASAFAGHNKLNKIILLWDSNDIQLDDQVSQASSEDVLKRYEAYGWNTLLVKDANDKKELEEKIELAQESDKPTIIEIKSIIGYGSENEGTSAVHGAPLSKEDIQHVKERYDWKYEKFVVPDEVYNEFRENTLIAGNEAFNKWKNNVKEYSTKYTKEYKELEYVLNDKAVKINNLTFDLEYLEASRVSSHQAINNINDQIVNLVGGSADLSKSNNTYIKDGNGIFSDNNLIGQNIYYGVREFAMAAINNGIVLHGGLKGFCATFFVFSDYLKPAIRLSAIQNIPAIYVFTHDSVFVGEDGPTHEPIEQLTGLRAIPGVEVIRPADANETQVAWNRAISSKDNPTILVLSRQNLEVVTTPEIASVGLNQGAYILKEQDNYAVNIIATGSEINLALKIREELLSDNIFVQVVSMPSTNIFDNQTDEYRNEIIKDKAKNIYLEMSSAEHGYKYADHVYGIKDFGKSGKGQEVVNSFGFDVQSIKKYIKEEML